MNTGLKELQVAPEKLDQQYKDLLDLHHARETEDRLYRDLFAHAPDVYLVTDAFGMIQDVNHPAITLFGIPRESLLGKPFIVFVAETSHEAFLSMLARARTGDHLLEWDVSLLPHQGPPIRMSMKATLLRFDEEHFVAMRALPPAAPLHDHVATQCGQASALQQIEQLTADFLAHISHELRTPLNHVKGYASTLLRHRMQFDEQTTQEYLETISDESNKLARLIDDLLSSSQIERGGMRLEIETVFIDKLIRRAVQRWDGVEAHHFEAALPERVPPIPADPRRLEQVIDNLLANVTRHTPDNTYTLVSLQVTRAELVVSVSDNGPGLHGDDMLFLFDRFYQARQSQQRRRGLGLGLSICKGIIEQHGGRMWVKTAPGMGTTFFFSLPRRRALRSRAA